VRIKTGDRLQSKERNLEALGQRTQLRLRKIAVSPLDAAEFVEDWGGWSAAVHGALNISEVNQI
jgi:hypothetical protein